jgi:hypothetical protein
MQSFISLPESFNKGLKCTTGQGEDMGAGSQG